VLLALDANPAHRKGHKKMVKDHSSIPLINGPHVAVRLGQEKLRASQGYERRRFETQLPLVGIYSCLLCERRFSTKLQLNQHYRQKHGDSIHNYEGEGSVLVIWYPRLVRKLRDFQNAL